jgi:protein TonB
MTAPLWLVGAALQATSPQQPPVMVADSPPPVVAVPGERPSSFQVLVPPVPRTSAPRPPGPRILRPPQWRRSAQSLIMTDDYPASARARGEQGWVAFALQVGADGRVHGCAITGSSGSAVLDATTCSLLRRRARFTPARDSNGQPAPWAARGEVEWRLR